MNYIIRCRKCKRECHPWPLGHDQCAPKHWVQCISTDLKRHQIEWVPYPSGD